MGLAPPAANGSLELREGALLWGLRRFYFIYPHFAGRADHPALRDDLPAHDAMVFAKSQNFHANFLSRCKFAVEFYSGLRYTMDRRELTVMPNIKPISDLRNYSEVLHDVAAGAPVFLTKNGRGRYAILDIQDYERTQAALRLMNELAKGRQAGEEKGWRSLEAVEEQLGIANE